MKYNPHLCIDCQYNKKAHDRTELCDECFDKQLSKKIREDDND